MTKQTTGPAVILCTLCPWCQPAQEGPRTYPVTAGFSRPHFGGDALEDGLDVGPAGGKRVVQLPRTEGLRAPLSSQGRPLPPNFSFLMGGGSALEKVMNKLSPQGKPVGGCGLSGLR